MISLRPYQAEAVAAIIAALPQRPIMVLPTGGGKTRCAAAVIEALGKRTLFIAHLRTLIFQAADRFDELGLDCGVVMASEPSRPYAQVQIASRDTLIRRDPLQGIELVIVDECHTAIAPNYRKVLDAYSGVPLIGLTATPFRKDKKPLGLLFGEIVVGTYADELCEQGFLVDPRVFVPDSPDLSGVHKRDGDFVQDEVEERVNTSILVGNIVAQWKERAAGRRTVCFAVSVAHSKRIVEQFTAAGIPSAHLDAHSPQEERNRVLADLREGHVQVVSNVGLFGEGWDLPELECCIDAAPTSSLQRFFQRIGRVARAAHDKADALYLDHAGNHIRLKVRMTTRLRYSLAEKVEKEEKKGPPTRECPECHALLQGRPKECPECGHVFEVKSREGPDEVEGDLQELGAERKKAPFPVRLEFWLKLEEARGPRGLSWSTYRYKTQFHRYPVLVGTRLVDTDNPTLEDQKEIFKKHALAWLKKPKPRPKPGQAAARFKGDLGFYPPYRWTKLLEQKAAALDAAETPLLRGTGA